jgi:hypothetical protein
MTSSACISFDPADSLVATMHFMPPESIPTTEQGVSIDGKLVPVLHQWDRNDTTKAYMEAAPQVRLDGLPTPWRRAEGRVIPPPMRDHRTMPQSPTTGANTTTIGLSAFCEGTMHIGESEYVHRLAFFVPSDEGWLQWPISSSTRLRGPVKVMDNFYRRLFIEFLGQAELINVPRVIQGVSKKLCYSGGFDFPITVHPHAAEVYFDFWPSKPCCRHVPRLSHPEDDQDQPRPSHIRKPTIIAIDMPVGSARRSSAISPKKPRCRISALSDYAIVMSFRAVVWRSARDNRRTDQWPRRWRSIAPARAPGK